MALPIATATPQQDMQRLDSYIKQAGLKAAKSDKPKVLAALQSLSNLDSYTNK